MNEMIGHVVFCDQILSSCMMISRSIHVIAYVVMLPSPQDQVLESQCHKKMNAELKKMKTGRVYQRQLVYKGADKKECHSPKGQHARLTKAPFQSVRNRQRESVLQSPFISPLSVDSFIDPYLLIDTRQSQDAFFHDQHSFRAPGKQKYLCKQALNY